MRLNTNFGGGNAVDFYPYIPGVSNAGFQLSLGGTGRLWIRSDGNVGIGTATPSEKLEVIGTVKATAFSGNGSGLTNVGGTSIPSGVIVMWSGSLASIPTGWALCDGTNGTPDLRDRFIVGTSTAENPGAVGGLTSHAHAVNSHSHDVDPAATQTTVPNLSEQVAIGTGKSAPGLNHIHTVDIASFATASIGGTTDNQDHRPPFFKLAFIMKL